MAWVNAGLAPLRAHWRGLLLLLAGIALPAFGLALLAEDVWTREGFAWDRPVQQWAHALASPGLTRVVIWITKLGYPWGVLPASIAALLFLLLTRRLRSAGFLFVAVGGAVLLELLGKLVFQRVRPSLWSSPAPATGYSFPSGHATLSASFVLALVLLTWSTRARWPVLVLGGLFALAVGFSRVYLGVHYPSDILAAWALATAWVAGAGWLLRVGPGARAGRAAEAAEAAG